MYHVHYGNDHHFYKKYQQFAYFLFNNLFDDAGLSGVFLGLLLMNLVIGGPIFSEIMAVQTTSGRMAFMGRSLCWELSP